MDTNKHEKLLYKDLSYQIQGAAIEVRKNFGPGLKESIYQNAFAEELTVRNIQFEKEKSIQVFSPKTGKLIGSYRPDFIVESKVLIELKAVRKIPKMFLDQLYSYLKNSKYELGYFINFASPKLYTKRIIFTNDRKMFLKNILVSISLIFVLFGVLPSAVQAAEIYLEAPGKIGVGEQALVDVFIDAGDDTLNAVEGELVFPADLVEVAGVFERDSVITFWLEKPHLDETDNRIKWSGVAPGGFGNVLSPVGPKPARLFSVVFEGKKAGTAQIGFGEIRALLNDGEGTPAELSVSAFTLTISEEGFKQAGEERLLVDDEPPQEFTPLITAEPGVFNGRWFLVFNTQDKESGIQKYEILEKRTLLTPQFWKTAESPYLLKDQDLKSRIYVKAVDNLGNERIVELTPTYPLSWYDRVFLWVIMIVILDLVVLLCVKFLWRKK